MPRLIVHPRTPLAWEIQLQPGENYLGRAFANDFKIEDPSVSGSHCQIVVQEGRITVKDLGSTNGTFLNRAPVQEEAAFQPGQTLHLGNVELFFDAGEIAAPPAIPPAPVPVTMLKLTTGPGPARLVPVSAETEAPPPAPVPAQPPIPRPLTDLKFAPRPGPARSAPPLPPTSEPDAPESAPVAGGAPHPTAPTAIHVGIQSCKFHPKSPAQWMCQPCHKYYCEVCTGSKRGPAGLQRICRTCGGECVRVIATANVKKIKEIKHYSDGVVILRSFGFAAAGALLSMGIWIGMVWLTGLDVSFIYSMIVGALCGYGVKLGAQDRPGAIFSAISIISCVVAIGLSKFIVYEMTHLLFESATKIGTDIAGIVAGIGLAYKIGGSE